MVSLEDQRWLYTRNLHKCWDEIILGIKGVYSFLYLILFHVVILAIVCILNIPKGLCRFHNKSITFCLKKIFF